MADHYLVTCECGRQVTVSAFAFGMTAPCGGCGKPLAVNKKTAKPLEQAREPVAAPWPIQTRAEASATGERRPLPTIDRPEEQAPTACARCGKPFRGSYDQVPTTQGVICYICSNQATYGQIPLRIQAAQTPTTPQPEPIPDAAIRAKTLEEEANEHPTFLGIRTDTDEFRRIILGLGLGVVVLTTILVSVEGLYVEREATLAESTAIEQADIPGGVRRWIAVFDVFATWLAGLIGVIAAMRIFDEEVSNHWAVDVLAVGALLIPFTVVHFVLGAAQTAAAAYQFGGAFTALFLLTKVIVTGFILHAVLDMGIRSIALAWVLYALALNLVGALKLAVLGTWVNTLT